MQIIEWAQFLKDGLPYDKKQFSMTVGIFDGVHRGHQELLKRVVSHNADFVPVVITFKEKNEKRKMKKDRFVEIQSFEERLLIFENLGIQVTIVIDFTEEFKRMPGLAFLETLVNRCGIGFFAVGSDFCCGYRLDTDAKAIQDFFASHGISAEIVQQVMEDFLPISSSRIRAAIAAGDTELAEKMLGRR